MGGREWSWKGRAVASDRGGAPSAMLRGWLAVCLVGRAGTGANAGGDSSAVGIWVVDGDGTGEA